MYNGEIWKGSVLSLSDNDGVGLKMRLDEISSEFSESLNYEVYTDSLSNLIFKDL